MQKLVNDTTGDTQETSSAVEATRLRSQGYRVVDGPAKNKARTTESAKVAKSDS